MRFRYTVLLGTMTIMGCFVVSSCGTSPAAGLARSKDNSQSQVATASAKAQSQSATTSSRQPAQNQPAQNQRNTLNGTSSEVAQPLPYRPGGVSSAASVTTTTLQQDSASSDVNSGRQAQTAGNADQDSGSSSAFVNQMSPREHLHRAIALLQNGAEARAKKHLDARLQLIPGDSVATNLLEQIKKSPSELFENDYFTYRTQTGDTLSSIAQKFLNDRFKFYSLAKYNSISDPSRLRVGQVIKIPGDKPAQPIVRKPREAKDEYYATAKRYFDQSRYQDVIDLLESDEARSSRGEQSVDLLVLAYSEQAKIYAEKADLINARVILKRALKIQPDNKGIKTSLSNIQAKLEVGTYWEKADRFIQAGKYKEAYKALREVLKRDPEHDLANKQIKKLKPRVIDTAYRDCILAYKRHEFDEAVSLCDKVLAIEPDHELAKLHRARAKEIMRKIQDM